MRSLVVLYVFVLHKCLGTSNAERLHEWTLLEKPETREEEFAEDENIYRTVLEGMVEEKKNEKDTSNDFRVIIKEFLSELLVLENGCKRPSCPGLFYLC